MGSSGRVSLRACGGLRFFASVFTCSCGEVGPLAWDWTSLLAKAGQDFCVHIPAAASVGGALLINSIVLDESLHLYSDEERGRKPKCDSNYIHIRTNTHKYIDIYCILYIQTVLLESL